MGRVELIDTVTEASGAAAEAIAADVDACLAQMVADGLAGVAPPETAVSAADAGAVSGADGGSAPGRAESPVRRVGAGRRVGPVAVLDRRLWLVGDRADDVHDRLLTAAEELLADLIVQSSDSVGGTPAPSPEGDPGRGGDDPAAAYPQESVVIEVVDDQSVRVWGPGEGYRSFDGERAWLDALPTDLNRHLMRQDRCLVLHAAALMAPGGQVVVLPAPSGSGKSTLAAQLVRAGWRYLSDEAVGLRFTDLATVAYPKPLVLSPESGRTLGLAEPDRLNHRPGSLGGRVLPSGSDQESPVSVVIPRYQPGVETTLRSLDPAEVLAELVPEVLNFGAAGVQALEALTALVSDRPGHELVHPGGDRPAAVLRDLLEREDQPAASAYVTDAISGSS